jgi:GxxExxY protein
MMNDEQLLHREITHEILGAFFELHSLLGNGFLEKVYANGMAVLLQRRGLAVRREQSFDIVFHGVLIGRYRADLIVESKVIVEVKTGRLIDPAHLAQVRNYMRASGIHVGLLCSFGPSAQFKRLICTAGQIQITA